MNWRYRFILSGFIFLFVLVLARLFYWQVVRADELSVIARNQYERRISLDALRGEIKTSDNFPIAANKLTYLLFANPKQIKDTQKIAEKISSVLEADSASISAVLELDKFWVSIQNDLNHDQKEKISSMNIPGIGFEEQSSRFYPEASMAAKLLGFVGKGENGESKGYFGLEGYYDRQLKGKGAEAVVIHDALGKPILSKLDKNNKIDGRTLVLHTDRTIQFLLDEAIKDGVKKYGAKSAMAAVMDPKTGGILAMSSFPNFDPSNYAEYSDLFYKNPFISDTYEPGSTFKPLIMSSALDAGLVKADTKCSICSGPVSIGGYEIKTWNDKYYAGSSMTDVIMHSDNTGMVFAGQKLGLDKMVGYLQKFGIGETTGIDLQGEVGENLRPRDNWYPIDVATASFGQGITVTPIQLLTAFSAIANEGKRMEPHVVAKIITADAEEIKIKPKVLSRPISDRAAKVITEMMVNAVDNGEAKFAKPEGYRIAGKTGTAQIPVAGHYDPTKTIASFIGFAPADDPKFLMLVIFDRPTSSIYGAETAAPVFFSVAQKILTYYGITPTN